MIILMITHRTRQSVGTEPLEDERDHHGVAAGGAAAAAEANFGQGQVKREKEISVGNISFISFIFLPHAWTQT